MSFSNAFLTELTKIINKVVRQEILFEHFFRYTELQFFQFAVNRKLVQFNVFWYNNKTLSKN